jgi:GNAT superfamily N-acetyltransferase
MEVDFVVEHEDVLIGCGGWSRRRSLYGGDAGRVHHDEWLHPETDAARIRAFFVHPDFARRGIGRTIMVACESAIRAAGFRRVEIVATLAGEPLYAAFGCSVVERFEIPLPRDLRLPVVRMAKVYAASPARPPAAAARNAVISGCTSSRRAERSG